MAMIGFSTGAVALADFRLALKLLEPTGADAVELSALRSSELPGLINALPSLLGELRKRYRYVGFHAPTNFDDENDVVDQLMGVAEMGLNIVVHPDTIRDASPWRRLGSHLCLENMDSRKSTGRTAEELESFFSTFPEARLCFDIAHARQVDPTMTEADRILTAFGNRLAQVHLSEVNSKGKHFAMSFAAKLAYEPFAEILSKVPIILESVVGEDAIVSEIGTAENLFGSRAPHAPYSPAKPNGPVFENAGL